MFDRFTDDARKLMGHARQQSQSWKHDYIGTEHILLGLIKESNGVAADVLKSLDVDLKKVRQEVEKLVTYGTSMVTMGQLPFTPRGKKVLELALEEANNLGHNYIGTEHLLLGLIREQEGIAAQVLAKLDVNLLEAREEILELLGRDPAEAASARFSEVDQSAPPSSLLDQVGLLAEDLARLKARVEELEHRLNEE